MWTTKTPAFAQSARGESKGQDSLIDVHPLSRFDAICLVEQLQVDIKLFQQMSDGEDEYIGVLSGVLEKLRLIADGVHEVKIAGT